MDLKGESGRVEIGSKSLLNSLSWDSFILMFPPAFTPFNLPSFKYLLIVKGCTFRTKAACLTLSRFSINKD